MTYLLDTCIISKLRKLSFNPDPILENWISIHPYNSFYLSVITIGELQSGIAKLNINKTEEHKHRMVLENWLYGSLIPQFKNRILDINLDVVTVWGKIIGTNRQNGYSVPVVDGLIAATAIHHNLIVVTDNGKDFEKSGAEIFNPWN